MTDLTRERMNFFEHLHAAFMTRTGYGAFSVISPSDALTLFDQYSNSSESEGLFINQLINSIFER